ncbi:MAG: mannose-6-phosphate isomerase [Candidatus Magasanikbacteria bacterium CG_4_9_14_0_2_um_filter_42_11]|uniref:Mannose-6-phosphate isomerase n=1 Tax=Candidatus Magasanikbacteria bacterium CG_4_9_14_0_2_um_filter_42_11 TaxID=1974643 RepID=A0A2M8F9C0_9BACT|nr:MAG: mannose-6-phosphate isomerase [Candidatus Magasanikbacteria bacterium CG10_big_fil_rev_8_21_14_0_10_43_9]PIY92065.1 MAG: mannose-6-phosphate isomerase [Candidatus Magasanikbacteria bacterium CG_4_10_14_0_8_um_filter_42_12]PJC52332.1 MAG: mannose-6-phosphate isomerase [Candidatus Magasanikbacteria bacterium CG_4_9_14_0_2_um_filter_42_11]
MYNFTEERPWGGFENLLEADTHKVKRLVVKPGQRLSYQLHHKRQEHWFIVSGTGIAIIDDEEKKIKPGDSIDVAIEQKHRIANTGDEDLIFIEVQIGTYFGEDDIERLSDDYQRV